MKNFTLLIASFILLSSAHLAVSSSSSSSSAAAAANEKQHQAQKEETQANLKQQDPKIQLARVALEQAENDVKKINDELNPIRNKWVFDGNVSCTKPFAMSNEEYDRLGPIKATLELKLKQFQQKLATAKQAYDKLTAKYPINIVARQNQNSKRTFLGTDTVQEIHNAWNDAKGITTYKSSPRYKGKLLDLNKTLIESLGQDFYGIDDTSAPTIYIYSPNKE